MKTPQDRYIKVGTVNTRYWTAGDAGSTVVLIHGLGGYVENWLPSFDLLAAQHRVYALDLLGHGRTDKPLDVPYKVPDLARFVKNFMTELGIERAHIVGHSLGGAISAQLALEYPEMVDRLTLVSSGGFGKDLAVWLRMCSIPVLGEMVTRPSRSGSAIFYKAIVHDPAVVTDELIELDYQMTRMPFSQPAFLRALRASCTIFGQDINTKDPIVASLAAITKPVFVVWGCQDPTIPVAHAEIAEKTLPNVKVQRLDACGHMPMLEQPQAFNDGLLEFLRDEK